MICIRNGTVDSRNRARTATRAANTSPASAIALSAMILGTAALLYSAQPLRHVSLPAVATNWLGPIVESVTPAWLEGETHTHAPENVATLFARIDYRLDEVRASGEVPRLFLASLPPELAEQKSADRRKVMFVQTTLPLILHANEMILRDRARVILLRDKMDSGEALDDIDQDWLQRLATRHGLAQPDFSALLARVDVVPPSLALAQAAQESGWGSSRFAHEGRALYGQRTFSGEEGMVPTCRESGTNFKVRGFAYLVDCVQSYTSNLNTHEAYNTFRKLRAKMRADGLTLNGHDFAQTLDNYSEERDSYVRALRAIIKSNDFGAYDSARLSERIARAS